MTTLEDAPAAVGTNNVVDLTDLLAKSLAKRKPGSSAGEGTRGKVVNAKNSAPKKSAV